jgi:hypothetical protein
MKSTPIIDIALARRGAAGSSKRAANTQPSSINSTRN